MIDTLVCASCLARAEPDEARGWRLWLGGGECPACAGAVEVLVCDVPGIAETKGSWRSLKPGVFKADNPREAAWAETVAWAAKIAMRGRAPAAGRLLVDLGFRLPPPPDGSKRNRRDIDKLVRSILDALGNPARAGHRIAYADDEQVDVLVARKTLEPEVRRQGASIRVVQLAAR